MDFSYHPPPPPLAPWVKTVWCARGTKQEFDAPEPIVPDGCVEIIFNLADPFRNGEVQPYALLAGQMTRPVVAVPTGAVNLIGVRFWPGRAGAALRTPMWELQDRLVDATTVAAGMDHLVADLRELPGDRRLDYLCDQLARRFGSRAPRFDGAVDHALGLIAAHRGNIGIDRLAGALAISRRHLERRFRDEVGLPAKQLARIARVHAALGLIASPRRLSGAEIAAACGYSDQAHLIRDCRAIAGRTPAQLRTTRGSLAAWMREEAASHSA